ncbi:TetR family transcriptional regulator [Acuticoccus sediminis]|uniref:TetR family transcriptional regulator n=1 Tax=Acuticoccus sediminis TaxID=2184697 RepID=A0A8B2NW67_9HYPH|nr:TetR/AcrR family transcriptional regulator [Acuticoccus sediminis]RAI01622.1 TetR family transcriptional regulator [Acuticoccus sediminis]
MVGSATSPDRPPSDGAEEPGRRRLSKAQRRRQLLETALLIVREEGADRLTLGHLAARAGVSKPVAYDHFGTRAGLLIDLYKSIDVEQSNTLREALTSAERSFDETVDVLATTYIHCSADTSGVWHAVGAALAGSEEMDAVHRELLDGYVRLFATVLARHSALPPEELVRRCIGMIGAGEALAAAMLRGTCSEPDAAAAFAALIRGGLSAPSRAHGPATPNL